MGPEMRVRAKSEIGHPQTPLLAAAVKVAGRGAAGGGVSTSASPHFTAVHLAKRISDQHAGSNWATG